MVLRLNEVPGFSAHFKPKGRWPLHRSRRSLNLLGFVGRARGFRSSRDPQTRGTEGSRVRAARVTKKERNSRGAAETAAPPALHFRMWEAAQAVSETAGVA